MSILGIIIVDTWQMYHRMTFPPSDDYVGATEEVQKVFYSNLATELIDNHLDDRARRKNMNQSRNDGVEQNDQSYTALCYRTGAPRCNAAAHLTPTKRYRITKHGKQTKTRFQGHCRVCKNKTIHQCSLCLDDPDVADEGWICPT